MKRKRQNESGIANLMVLILALALFLLLSVAIQANFAWRRSNRQELRRLQVEAEQMARPGASSCPKER
jgi:hypothetical protein